MSQNNRNQKVFMGTKYEGSVEKKVVVVIQTSDSSPEIHTYVIKKELLSKQQLDTLFNGGSIFFPNPHDHSIHDARTSDKIPIYCRVNRPDIIDSIGKQQHHKALSLKHRDILKKEIQLLSNKVSSISSYNKDLFAKARFISDSIKDLRSNKKLLGEQSRELRDDLQKVFDRLIKLREDDQKKYEKECDSNFREMSNKISNLQRYVNGAKDFREARNKVKEVRENLKKTNPVKKDQRDKLWDMLNRATETLNKRQDEDRKRYERECESNYLNARSRVYDAKNATSHTEDWKGGMAKLKQAKQYIFDVGNMNKEKRNELKSVIKDAMDNFCARRERFFQKKQEEFKQRIREKIRRKRDSIEKIQSSIYRKEESIRDQYSRLRNVKPGNRAYEIKSSINNRISNMQNAVSDMRRKIDSIRYEIRDLETKL